MAQVALAWLLARGPDIVPIPGTKRRTYLEQNVAAVDMTLTEADGLPSTGRSLPGPRPGCAIPNSSSRPWEFRPLGGC